MVDQKIKLKKENSVRHPPKLTNKKNSDNHKNILAPQWICLCTVLFSNMYMQSNFFLTGKALRCNQSYVHALQVKSHTTVPGRDVAGSLPAPTSWPATTGNTPVTDPSSATSVRGHSPALTTLPCTWRDTCENMPYLKGHLLELEKWFKEKRLIHTHLPLTSH